MCVCVYMCVNIYPHVELGVANGKGHHYQLERGRRNKKYQGNVYDILLFKQGGPPNLILDKQQKGCR